MSPMRRSHLVAAAVMIAAALSHTPVPSQAASEIDWNNKRDAARAHATAIQQAWSRLAAWIERRPREAALRADATDDPDLTGVRGPHIWLDGPNSQGLRAGQRFAVVTMGIPPDVRPTWNPVWTDRGLSFAFCDQVLAVYAEADVLRGTDMPTVAVEGGLQIIRGAEARGTPQSGYPSMTIPDCMRPSLLGADGLPANGHVALVATAIDPFHWTATKRRNEHDDWELPCTAAGHPATWRGKVRYAQTRPIELHPWARPPADMDRWPALCRDRPAAGGTFSYTGPVYGTVTGVLPEHGQCDPPGTANTHMSGAIVNDGCRAPTLIGGRRGARWHFFDTLCQEADTDGIVRDGSVWHGPRAGQGISPVPPGREGWDGVPYAPALPALPACSVRAIDCSDGGAPYSDGFDTPAGHNPGPGGSGSPGTRTLIEKRRALWKESEASVDSWTSGPGSGAWTWGTGPRYRREHDGGEGLGNKWFRRSFAGCYEQQIEHTCTCAAGYEASGAKVYWDFHPHDGRGRVFKGDNCACTFIPVWVDEDGDGQSDGVDTDGDGDADQSGPEGGTPGTPGSNAGEIGGIGGVDGGVTGGHTPGQSNSGSDGGGDGDGGCFLTTAVVERRGEADDGPTLTALREFRDRYMMTSPERMMMVAQYYRRAPAIVAAIPQDHPEWDWIGARIDEAVAAIRAGDDEAAFGMYVGAMRALDERWGSGD